VDALLASAIGLAHVRSGNTPAALALWIPLLAGTVFEVAGKHFLPHPAVPPSLRRPSLNPTHHLLSTRHGFPSGHARRTVFPAAALWPALKRRWPAAAAAAIAVAAVHLGLIYLGDHWASEVIAGDLLAGLCLALRGPSTPS